MSKTNEPVDLASFDEVVKRQEDGILVPIKSMDEKTLLGFSIRVAGPDSACARRATEQLADELIAAGKSEPAAGENIEQGLRYLAKITLGWEPSIILDGSQLAYSEENALALYKRFNFIKVQVDNAAGKRSRFMKG